jgi:glycosyltransferase involved in cell wall biosynthesis
MENDMINAGKLWLPVETCATTCSGGIPEVLGDGRYGMLARPADPDSLAQALLSMARMPVDKRSELAAVARTRARDVYSHTIVREKLRSIYESEYIQQYRKG